MMAEVLQQVLLEPQLQLWKQGHWQPQRTCRWWRHVAHCWNARESHCQTAVPLMSL